MLTTRPPHHRGCEPRIEVIVKMQKEKSEGVPSGGVVVRGFGGVNQKLKVLLKEHKGIVQY